MNKLWVIIKQAIKDYFSRPLMWLFGIQEQKQKIDRSKTTEEFKVFKEKEVKRDDMKKVWQSDNNYLIRYILFTKKSPFLGDWNFKEAQKFLLERGVRYTQK